MKKIIYTILFHGLTSLYAQPPEENNFYLYSRKDGISNDYVTAVVQDEFGFIWVATRKGLNRFDGNNFQQFYADSSSNSLPQDDIAKLKLLPNNLLAATTSTGLFLINTKSLLSKTITIPPDSLKYVYKVNNISDMEGDKEGNIYLLTRSGFYAVDAQHKLWFRYDHYSAIEAEKSPFFFGYSIINAGQGKYVLSTVKGALIFDPAAKKLQPLEISKDPFLLSIMNPDWPFRTIYNSEKNFVVLKDSVKYLDIFDVVNRNHTEVSLTPEEKEKFDYRSGMFMITDSLYAVCGGEKGFYLIRYSKQMGQYLFEPQLHFEKYSCKAILRDRENMLWIGTNKGLFKQKNSSGLIEKIQIPTEMNPDSRDLYFTNITLANDRILAGSNTRGLFILNRSDGKALKHFDFKSIGLGSNNITSCLTLNNDSVLVATNGPLLVVSPVTFKYNIIPLPGWDITNWVSTLYKDRNGNIYAPYNSDGKIFIRRYNEPGFQNVDHSTNPLFNILMPTHIIEDPDNNIWFTGHGMSRYNISTGRFDIKLDSFPKIKTERKEVGGLAIDENGLMYFGIAENGLVIYNPSTRKFEQVTRNNGLPDNQIMALYLLKNVLWIGTASGLASYDITTKKVTSWGIGDDMPEESFTGYSFYYDSIHSQMYAPFKNTILRFDPSGLQKNSRPPGFFIESIRINDQKVIYHPGSEISLSFDENNLVVNLASINFEDPREQQFYYRFTQNHENTEWEFAGSQKNFILSNLATGNHTIQFKVASKTNSWQSQVIDIKVHIKPPFWKTAWFIILGGLVILATLILLYRARISRIRQKANIDKQLAELEIKGLHAQMNPHFIFNALNSIKEMIWDNEKANASRYLSRFAQLIRTNLEQSKQAFITVAQCILHLEQYLEMEKIRFSEFDYKVTPDESIAWDDIKMAPMLVQPLVENAIWHGLKNQPGEKKLAIRFFIDSGYLVCEIEDNGPGILHQNKQVRVPVHNPIGIANIHQRLKVLNEKYNMKCSLQFIDKSETGQHGTIAILRLTI
ncbi:MAG TPA: histidine kinase [Ferruginibacter sp.]|nr:histidine kinase [Ferruginibacter sp.]